MATDSVTFADVGVTNDTGIDITQGMVDGVANPFLDLDAIVTQFAFNNPTNVTIKIPAGMTVKYGEETCTLLEDATATISAISSDSGAHATTTAGTVLSDTHVENGQLITTSGQWTVVLENSVDVRTQDGYAILGTKDPSTLSGGDIVSLSEGTNIYVTSEINVTKVNEKAAQFYFLADVTYHQIVLQELYDALAAMQDAIYKQNLLAYFKEYCVAEDRGRDQLSQEEYDELQGKSLDEIKIYLDGLKLLPEAEEDLSTMQKLDDLVNYVSQNSQKIIPSDLIFIYDGYGAFSDVEIQNLKNNKSLDGTSSKTWTVDNLLGLVDDGSFSDAEIDAIRKSAAQAFFESLIDVPYITVEDIKTALKGLYTVSGDDIETISSNLASVVGESGFTLDEFDQFLKNFLNTTKDSSEICVLQAWMNGTRCLQLSDAAKIFFTSLSDNRAITSDYLTSVFGSAVSSVQALQNKVLSGETTIQNIYDEIKNNRSNDVKYQEKDDNGNYKEAWPPSGVNNPNKAGSLVTTENVDAYFDELKKYTECTGALLGLSDFKNVCEKLGVTEGTTVDTCIANLKNAITDLKIDPSDIDDQITAILDITKWKSSALQITQDNGMIRSIVQNPLISLSELKDAVSKTGVYSNSSVKDLKDKIQAATSKFQVIEILSQDELTQHIKVCNLVTGLTQLRKYDGFLYKKILINEISQTGKLNDDILFECQLIADELNNDGAIIELSGIRIINKLKEKTRLDVDLMKTGLLTLTRVSKSIIETAMHSGQGNRLDSQEYNDNLNKLLNLCLLAGTPPDGQSEYALATGVVRTVDSDGNYVYSIEDRIGDENTGSVNRPYANEESLNASFSKQDATAGMALPYFALAIMYEKTCIQQMILVEQLKQIEKINDEIRKNNDALKALTDLYDKIYTACTWSAKSTEVSKYYNLSYSVKLDDSEMSVKDLNTYIAKYVNEEGLGPTGDVNSFHDVNAQSYRVNDDEFITVVGRYDRDGNNMWERYTDTGKNGELEDDFDSNTSNIDVKEQATLTHISNLQDQVRMYGDSLSTDAQLMTTKMEQYMQDANSCVSACTQTVKSIGDYFKNIITNIR